jgi:hypothetical protein
VVAATPLAPPPITSTSVFMVWAEATAQLESNSSTINFFIIRLVKQVQNANLVQKLIQ